MSFSELPPAGNPPWLASLRAGCAPDPVLAAEPADRVDHLQPLAVARPGSTAGVARVLRHAAEEGLAVVCRGSGSRTGWGGGPARAEVVLDTTGLDRVVEHTPDDLVVVVEAGVRLGALQQLLARHQQRLALDLAESDRTVGGILATASAGPLRLRYGSPRDLVIGTTVVRPDATAASSGGKVVKNVAGYDLGKLVIGSFGTLAVLTRVVFRVHPIPTARRVVTAQMASTTAAGSCVEALLRARFAPAAAELRWSAGEGPPAVAVLLEGTAAGVTLGGAELTALLARHGEVTGDDAEPPGWWGREPVAPGGGMLLRVGYLPAALPALLAALAELAAALRAPVQASGSAGVGVVHVTVGAPTGAGEVGPALLGLQGRLRAADGWVMTLTAPPGAAGPETGWTRLAGYPLMQRLKAAFDPAGRLAPGRWVTAA